MPLYKEWSIDDDCLAAIWKIEEPEEFFRARIGAESGSDIGLHIKNDKRRMEHLAGRFLLKHLKDDFPLMNIRKDVHDKPRVEDCFFSISHSWPYIAVVVNPFEETGIDVQTWHPRILDIQHKFLGVDEQEFFGTDPKLVTLAWAAKEAVYKYHGKKGVEFITDIPVNFFSQKGELYNIVIYSKVNEVPQMITLEGQISDDFACVYVIKAEDWVIY